MACKLNDFSSVVLKMTFTKNESEKQELTGSSVHYSV